MPAIFLVIALALGPAGSGCRAGEDGLTIYAAVSLTAALEDAARVYTDSTGVATSIRYGASGQLAAAIASGAPADLFLAADARWMDYLADRELLVPGSARIVAWNRLVCAVPLDSAVAVPPHAAALVQCGRIAVGDSATVPAGRYARQALAALGLADSLEGKFVETADARAALYLVERGEVDAGLVYESDARTSERVRIAFVFPERSHDPVAYPAAIVRASGEKQEAQRFLEFLSSPRGRSIFLAHGLQES